MPSFWHLIYHGSNFDHMGYSTARETKVANKQ
jgi:hypothetical protein